METVLKRSRTPRMERRPQVETRARVPRVTYLDNIKLLLVAVIIAGHGALAYSSLESAWPYQDIQETQLGTAADLVLLMVVIPAALFAMGLFFLISGLVTPGALSRHGARTFARNRLIRLGVPLALWTLIAWPGAIWISHEAAGDPRSFWDQLFVDSDPFLDPGPMWFVEVLLIYSLAYAAWRSWRSRRMGALAHELRVASTPRDTSMLGRTLVLLAIGISVATALIRPVFPIASAQIGQLKLFQWPQFAAMFGLGIVAAQRGWLTPVPEPIRRRCGFAAFGGVLAFFALFAIASAVGDEDVVYDTGVHWAPLVLAVIEGPLAVGASVWLLGTAQQRLDRRPGPFIQAMARSAYAAFVLQGIVLIALMVAMRPIAVPAEIKALAVAGLGVAGSFGLAWTLVSRTPVGRVL